MSRALTPAERLAVATAFLALPLEASPSCQDASSSDEAYDPSMCWDLLREAVSYGEQGFASQPTVRLDEDMLVLLLSADRDEWRAGRRIRIAF